VKIPQITHALQLWQAGGEHEREQRVVLSGPSAQLQVHITAHLQEAEYRDGHTLERGLGYLLEPLVHVGTLATHDVGKVGREDKRGALAFDTELLFEISQEVAEINVEQIAGTGDLNSRAVRK
jgi:hypothetical protein